MDQTQRVYQIFSPDPLTAAQLSLYVQIDDARGDENVVQTLARTIRLSANPVSQVLAGHKGSGKSTELMRLAKELEKGDSNSRYFVVTCRADDDIDRNDVDFPEVLMAIVRQLAIQLRERADIHLKPGYFSERLERLKTLLASDVSFDGIELDAGILTVSSTIKNSPDARAEIRKLLEPDTTNWLTAANNVIDEAMVQLPKKGYAGLVVLFEGLDKMIDRPVEHAGCSTTEQLFVHRAAQLTAFRCHTVYTLPLSLAYSHHEQTIKSSFGNHVPVLPMVRIAARPPKQSPYIPGIESLEKIVQTRCNAANIAVDQLFKDTKLMRGFIQLSGGQPRQLMELVRESILTSGLPIDNKALERARHEGQREYARMLRKEHWPILNEVRKTGAYIRTAETEALFRELIDSRALLQYRNADEWYGLNPMVAGLKAPAQPKKKSKKK